MNVFYFNINECLKIIPFLYDYIVTLDFLFLVNTLKAYMYLSNEQPIRKNQEVLVIIEY